MNHTHVKKMRKAGQATAQVLDFITPYVRAGVTTGYLDDLCNQFIVRKLHARPANVGYHGYPKTICTSINEVICHGIPDHARILVDGDILNIDVALKLNGVFGDASRMFAIGKISKTASDLIMNTQTALGLSIGMIRPGLDINDIGRVIEKFANSLNYGVIHNYCGHGIGKQYHEWPNVPHCAINLPSVKLLPGMIFTVEPMLTVNKHSTNHVLDDGWAVVTDDASLSAQWEHTILVTDNGFEILTLSNLDK